MENESDLSIVTKMETAAQTAQQALTAAHKMIDAAFGEGYAKAIPHLVIAMVQRVDSFFTTLWGRLRDGIEKDTRNDLMRCMENLPAIQAFRETLTQQKREVLNHPTTIRRAWKAKLARDEKEEALKRAEAAADSAKGDDGTKHFRRAAATPRGLKRVFAQPRRAFPRRGGRKAFDNTVMVRQHEALI